MPRALCFDMYGTLCDTSSVAARLGDVLDVPAALVEAVDRTWRRKQLQYSYQSSLMEAYEPFWTITERALEYALAQYDLDPDEAARARILEAYDHLEPFPGALSTLEELAATHTCVVLSNGNPAMLERLAANAGIDAHLDDIVSADEVGTFKPAPVVYENAADRLDRPLGECVLVSSNAWDVAGASAAGMGTAWVNRGRDPAETIGGRPELVLDSLAALPDRL